MHYNTRANGTMILTAMFNTAGFKGIEVFQLNPYNSTQRVAMFEYVNCCHIIYSNMSYCNTLRMYDSSYYIDLTYISNLPEGIPAALQQQTTAVVGDNFYSMLSYSPSKGSNSNDDSVQATYINM